VLRQGGNIYYAWLFQGQEFCALASYMNRKFGICVKFVQMTPRVLILVKRPWKNHDLLWQPMRHNAFCNDKWFTETRFPKTDLWLERAAQFKLLED
jgi:hypothetical protein